VKKELVGSIFSVVSQKLNLGVVSLIKQSANFPALLKKNKQAYNDSCGRDKFIDSILVIPKTKQMRAIFTVLFQDFGQVLVNCLYIFLAVFLTLHDKQK